MTDLPAGCPVNAASLSLQPVASGERIAVLDVLRGVALLGILLMNIEALSGPLDLAFTGIDTRWHGLDYAADAFVSIFVQGKFFTLFSLLFGAGFAVMAQRAQAAGREFAPFYLRRSLGLALIGGPEKVRARLDVLLEQTQADELIFTCDLYETADRHRAFEIVAGLRQ